MSATTAEPTLQPSETKQPKGLGMLFFAEMWERFSFYGMRGLLVLYLTRALFTRIEDTDERDAVAFGIYAAYGALVYATPFIGGLLADRVLGYKRAVLLGGVLMACGHLAMAIETEIFLYIALAFLIAGNGFFKPNISSMVGGLYKENDPRRDAGFTIFYMGINLGALLQLIPGALGERVGWWAGFGLAGIGMMLGVAVFVLFKHKLGTNGDPPDMAKLTKAVVGPLSLEWVIYIGSFLSVAVFALFVWQYDLMGYVLTPFALFGFGVVFVYAIRSEKVVRERLFVVLILTFFNVLFWAFFEQAGSSISLFTDRNVDRALPEAFASLPLVGQFIPTSAFQSVNPLFILIFALPFSFMWLYLERRHIDPPLAVKFVLGLLQLGLGFLVLAWAASSAFVGEREVSDGVTAQAALVPIWFLLFGYMLHTTGELCLSPIGLSMVTKLSPKKIVAMVMGLWFLSTSMSHHLAGIIATQTSSTPVDGVAPGTVAKAAGILAEDADYPAAVMQSFDQLASYADVFHTVGLIAIGAAAVLLVLSPFIKKWQHGIA